jgi:hypothetical protein
MSLDASTLNTSPQHDVRRGHLGGMSRVDAEESVNARNVWYSNAASAKSLSVDFVMFIILLEHYYDIPTMISVQFQDVTENKTIPSSVPPKELGHYQVEPCFALDYSALKY